MRPFLNLLFFWPALAFAQAWCPPGAEWTFRYEAFGIREGVAHVKYIGDTVLDGRPAQRLRHRIHYWERFGGSGIWDFGTFHTHYQDGVVYRERSLDTLMWFHAEPGQRWSMPSINGRTEVLDTTTVLAGGVLLRRSGLRIVDPWGQEALDELHERIGYGGTYFPEPFHSHGIDPTIRALICYRDSTMEFRAGWATDCGFTVGTPPGPHYGTTPPFPNPGTDRLTLHLPPGLHTIELFDATGRRVLQRRTTEDRPVIATEDLPPGIYHLHVLDGGGSATRHTWVRH